MAVTCNTWCLSSICKERKKCACQCESWFGGTNPVLVEPCQSACYNNPSLKDGTAEDYMCEYLNPQEVFNNLGYVCPEFNPLTDTAQGQAYSESQTKNKQTRNTIIGIAALVVVLIIVYIYI